MKIYISGKITNVENWEDNFNAVEYYIKTENFPKAKIYNPVRLSWKVQEKTKRPAHSDYMRYDIKKMLKCDAVYLIPHWEGSKGVETELIVAEACEIPVYRIPDDDFEKMMKDYYRDVKRGVYYTEQEVIKFREMQDRAWSKQK